MKKLFIIFLSLLSINACSYSTDRPPAVAGQFYPADPTELTHAIDSFLSFAPYQKPHGRIIGLLLPHAGYIYSGQTAAYGFKLIQNTPIKTVILIGNSHTMYLTKGAVYAKGSFRTPLGSVQIDELLSQKIMEKSSLFEDNETPHMKEHCLEVEIPFLQSTLSDFKIVPILLSGSFSLQDCEKMAKAIADAVKELKLEKTALILAFSDMSHYPSWANANMVDSRSLKAVEKFDPAVLKNSVDSMMSAGIPNEACVFCGAEAVYTGMYAVKDLGADNVKILEYKNSGDITDDKSRVVGYGAVVFTNSKDGALKQNKQKQTLNNLSGATSATKSHKDSESTNKAEKQVYQKSEGVKMDDFKILEKSQKELLKIARESIVYYLKNKKLQKVSSTDKELNAPGAVFVTLTKQGQLRGCIGTTVAQGPLINAVNEMAAAAAFDDTRFSPVDEKELQNIHIEISILSPMRKVKNADEIKQNIHGVVVRKGARGGLFLPQVWEHFSSKEDFMSELCSQKAGLSRDAWKNPDTDLYVFTVFAFEEPK